MRIRLDLRSPVLRNSELFARAARDAIEATIRVNLEHMRELGAPSLYSSGVRYRLEPPGVEDFTDLQTLLERGWGDCSQLAAWRVAELRHRGESGAGIRLTWRRNRLTGQRMFHVLVRRADGRIEDPSVRLGMHSGEAVTIDKRPVIGWTR